MLTIIIPSRNEPYLQKTIQDILIKAKGEFEIIAILDGWWEKADKIVLDKRVNYLHYSTPRGMRNAINKAVDIAKGEYLLKCDAHVMFAPGFDTQLIKDHSKKNDWVVVPRRYALDPVKWDIIDNPKYPIDYMYLDKDLHGVEWRERNRDPKYAKIMIDENMSSQGSCWFMTKKYYHQLGLLDEENYGIFWNEFQEIGLKCWLYQGKVMVNKNTWYAHWHKTESRGYSLSGKDHDKALAMIELWKKDLAWVKQQRHPLSWLINRFAPVPGWGDMTQKALIDDEKMFWRKWLMGDRGKRHMIKRPFTKEIMEMLDGKKTGNIADIGSGPVSCIGHYLPGGNVLYVPSDLLADEYAELFKYHHLIPPVGITKQDMTKMTYSSNLFDIVYCRNAMDHCSDPKSALKEMYRICKPGGWIYLWHFKNVGKMMGYRNMHQWNIEITEVGKVRFWNKKEEFFIDDVIPIKYLDFKTEPLKHPVIVVRIQK